MAAGRRAEFKNDAGIRMILARTIERASQTAPIPAVAQELRRIHQTRLGQSGHRMLTLCMERIGEAINPTQPIPVIDMESQRHDAPDIFGIALDLRQPAVGRWTTVASLRGIKLE